MSCELSCDSDCERSRRRLPALACAPCGPCRWPEPEVEFLNTREALQYALLLLLLLRASYQHFDMSCLSESSAFLRSAGAAGVKRGLSPLNDGSAAAAAAAPGETGRARVKERASGDFFLNEASRLPLLALHETSGVLTCPSSSLELDGGPSRSPSLICQSGCRARAAATAVVPPPLSLMASAANTEEAGPGDVPFFLGDLGEVSLLPPPCARMCLCMSDSDTSVYCSCVGGCGYARGSCA